MSEPKFTKGPWKITALKGEFDETIWIGPERFTTIANVKNGADDDEYGGIETELANAHLISAAPCMYEALHKAFEVIAQQEAEFGGPSHEGNLIRAALSKAEGKQ